MTRLTKGLVLSVVTVLFTSNVFATTSILKDERTKEHLKSTTLAEKRDHTQIASEDWQKLTPSEQEKLKQSEGTRLHKIADSNEKVQNYQQQQGKSGQVAE